MNALNQTTFAVQSVQASMMVLTDAVKIVQWNRPPTETLSVMLTRKSSTWPSIMMVHTSAYGIGCVTDTVTGLALDLAVLSSYCQAWSCAEVRCGGWDTGQFQTWLAHHTNCNQNYHGTSGSGGMEIQAADMLWDCSLDLWFIHIVYSLQ